jgi:glycosyl transferase family 8
MHTQAITYSGFESTIGGIGGRFYRLQFSLRHTSRRHITGFDTFGHSSEHAFPMRATIVSAADAGYFSQLKGLILSIHRHRPDDRVALAVLDLGLTGQQLEELKSLEASVVPGQWDFDFPQLGTTPRSLQWLTMRCVLPKYFPDADPILWLDADVWLQDWRAIDLLLNNTVDGSMVLVPEIHRGYSRIYNLGLIYNRPMYDHYAGSFGDELARMLAERPLFNAGAFAAQRNSPVWTKWAKWVHLAMQGTVDSFSDQNALNAAIYREQLSFVPLPAWCNWICSQARPFYDLASERFVECNPPHERISIVHVTSKSYAVCDVGLVGGGSIKLPLYYLPYIEARPMAATRA